MRLLLVLLLGLALQSTVLAQGNQSCFAASFITVASQFEYKAFLQPDGCNLSNTRATRLFMLGACRREHQNNFPTAGRPPHCPPGDKNVVDTSPDSCADAFEHAKPGDLRFPQGSSVFDAGSVCNDGYQGVIFVDTDCPVLNASSVQLMQRPGGPGFCWDGRTLSRGAFAGIIVGGVLGVLLLLSLPVLFCLWRRRRRQQAIQASTGAVQKDGSSAEKGEVAAVMTASAAAGYVFKAKAGKLTGVGHSRNGSLESIPEDAAQLTSATDTRGSLLTDISEEAGCADDSCEGEGYEVEYIDSECAQLGSVSSGIPVSSFANSLRTS